MGFTYFKSENVSIFPCSRRNALKDPQAVSINEYGITKLCGSGQSYIISKTEKTIEDKTYYDVELTIDGYYFKINDVEATVFGHNNYFIIATTVDTPRYLVQVDGFTGKDVIIDSTETITYEDKEEIYSYSACKAIAITDTIPTIAEGSLVTYHTLAVNSNSIAGLASVYDEFKTHASTTTDTGHITADERDKLSGINDNAEVNVVNAVSEEFEIDEETRKLSVSLISKEKIEGLADYTNAVDILNSDETTNGSVANQIKDALFNGSNAKYASLEQGKKADSALQSIKILGKTLDKKSGELTVNDAKTALGLKAADVSLEDANNKITATTVEDALTELATSIVNATVTVETDDDTTEYAQVYNIKQNGKIVGSINIPKDKVIQEGTVIEDAKKGTCIKLILANSENSEILIPVSDLIEYVTGGASDEITVSVSNDHVVTAAINEASIAKRKLATDVQASLDRADAAVKKVEAGTADGTIKVDNADVAITGLCGLAFKDKVTKEELSEELNNEIEGKLDASRASEFATADQGNLANSAIQRITILNKTLNNDGELTVNDAKTALGLEGLGGAAYKNEDYYAIAGHDHDGVYTKLGDEARPEENTFYWLNARILELSESIKNLEQYATHWPSSCTDRDYEVIENTKRIKATCCGCGATGYIYIEIKDVATPEDLAHFINKETTDNIVLKKTGILRNLTEDKYSISDVDTVVQNKKLILSITDDDSISYAYDITELLCTVTLNDTDGRCETHTGLYGTEIEINYEHFVKEGCTTVYMIGEDVINIEEYTNFSLTSNVIIDISYKENVADGTE